MRNAWRQVTDEKSATNWALFGYEGHTNTLGLLASGEEGIEELTDELNPSKIMYAFLRVEDPKTSLPKYVILNWQGETAPGTRKGTCAMHLRDVERFLHGHHLTISLRNEDEIDMADILQKVSKVTASAFNFKEKPQGMEHSPQPVGTAHKKINPLAELPAAAEREQFWSRDQEEERRRLVAERERQSSEQQRAEAERRQREEAESRLRETQIKERERKISSLRQSADADQADKINRERTRWEMQQEEDMRATTERNQRSERMRLERAAEARQLIQQREGDAKRVFQRNSSQGQMNFPKPSLPSNERVSRPAAAAVSSSSPTSRGGEEDEQQQQPRSNGTANGNSSDLAPPPPGFQQEEESPQVIHRASPAKVHPTGTGEPAAAAAAGHPAEEEEEEARLELQLARSSISPEIRDSGDNKDNSLESYGVCAVALYDYQASDETEISFDPGQIITHIDQIDPGWWQGLGPDGNYGLFPANYVEVIDNSELQIQA